MRHIVFLVMLTAPLAGSALATDGSSPSSLERLLAEIWTWLDGLGVIVTPGG